MSRAALLIQLLLIGGGSLRAQHRTRDAESRLFGGLAMNIQAPKLLDHSTGTATALPWPGASLDLGCSLTYRDRWGVAVQGSLATHGYLLWMDTVRYDIHHLTQRAELRIWRLFPWINSGASVVRIGMALGSSFQGSNELLSTKEPFLLATREEALTRFFIAPEVGLTKALKLQRLELGLRYLRHLPRNAAWTTSAISSMGNATFTGTDDHVALVFRYHFGIPRTAPATLPSPPPDHLARRTDTLAMLRSTRERIILHLWDNAEYDGDTVSVLLNGDPVLAGHELTRKRHRLVLYLRPGENSLLVVAHNEGRVPPNTASAQLRVGGGRQQLLIKTSLKLNTAVLIRRE